MQEIITLNGKKYVEYIEPEKEYKRWRAEKWEYYYWIKYDCSIDEMIEELDSIYYWPYNIGNYFQTRKEAVKERDKRLAIVRVNDKIMELNKWWEHNVNKSLWYYIYTNGNKFHYASHSCVFCCFVITYIRSEEIADKIIKEHQEDLKLIFWV